MKQFLLLTAFFSMLIVKGQNVKDSSFLVSATVNSSQKSITIKWTTTDAGSFQINRKKTDTNAWETTLATVNGSTNTYTDATPSKGVVYEYRILKIKSGSIRAIGYVASGIDIPLTHYKKNILILVDSTTYNGIDSSYWKTLKNDYYMDGYGVKLTLVSTYHTPVQIKSFISAWYNSNKQVNKHCLLIGRIPVAYSGNMLANTFDLPPDAHPDHGGAWPTDLYYAEMDGNWTDVNTMITNISRNENKNVPGDGKFDQHFIPDNIDIQIGRVDMRNLPSQGMSEIALIRQYLDKLHNYKSGNVKVPVRAFISDNFGYLGGEMPMRSGWNNASAVVGANNIASSGNYFDSAIANSYLWSNYMGGGSYSTCGGVGSSSQYKDSIRTVFNISFGSYFGDWDVSDNLLRSCLASKGLTLTNVWAHRPHWYFHQMAMGIPIGHSVITSQNNLSDFNLATGYIGSFSGNYLDRRISMNLLGDPTLRIRYFDSPKNPSSVAANNNKFVTLSWGASNESGLLGYNIYRTSKKDDVYYLVNKTPVSGLSYTDSTPFNGTNYYVIKAVKMETSNCGTYTNSSLGVMTVINNVNGNNTSIDHTSNEKFCFVYPNPANTHVYVHAIAGSTLTVYDMNGRTVKTITLTDELTQINTSEWCKGIYSLVFNTSKGQEVEKLVIQ
ncbi:MAG TPA: T9SS type A sorting domain-containing protein [Bacteroidia bacterium]